MIALVPDDTRIRVRIAVSNSCWELFLNEDKSEEERADWGIDALHIEEKVRELA